MPTFIFELEKGDQHRRLPPRFAPSPEAAIAWASELLRVELALARVGGLPVSRMDLLVREAQSEELVGAWCWRENGGPSLAVFGVANDP